MIKLENKRIHDFIAQKNELVDLGMKTTAGLEDIEKQIKRCEEKEKAITLKEKPDPVLKEEGDALVKVFNEALERLEEIGKQIEQKKMDAIPKDLLDEHKKLLKDKENIERERNKIAMKIQKIKDKVIPYIQKEVKPLLNEYDDIETADIKDGKIIIKTFNYLDDFKAKFKK